jgi:tetratricopeptide (TPR) repeat protein
LGSLLSNQKRFDEAKRHLDRALELSLSNQFNSYVYLSLGYLHLNQKNYVLALQAFTEANKLGPDDVNTLLGLANYYRNREDYHKAIDYCEKAINRDESNYAPYFVKAMCYFSLDQLEYAEKWLRKSRTKYPNDPGFDFALANLFFKKGDADKCISLFLRYSDHTKNKLDRSGTLHNIAYAYVYKGMYESPDLNFEEAVKYYKESLVDDPDNAASFYGLGVLYDKQGKISEAEEMIKKGIHLDKYNTLEDLYHVPQSEEWYWLALIYEVKGERSKAIAKWKEYLDKVKTEKKHKDRSVERAQEHLTQLTRK